MTTQKFIATAGLILTLALPSALLAGSVSGTDWYSTETGKTTNQIEQVMPVDSAIAQSGIGMDWYDDGDVALVKHGIYDRSFAADRVIGIGMDWHTEQTTPMGSGGNCLSIAANLNSGVNGC